MCNCSGNVVNTNINTTVNLLDCGCKSKTSPCNLESPQNLGLDYGITVIIQENLEKLLGAYDKAWTEERIKGKSFKTVWVSKFYAALVMALIIKYNSRCYNFDKLKELYNINDIIDCLKCDDINFIKMLNTFNLPTSPLQGGIENINIECLFEIEPDVKILPVKRECANDLIKYPNKSFLDHLKQKCEYAC